MESLIFVCPSKGRAIDSGISTHVASLTTVQDLKLDLKCPHCARRHRFAIRQGHLIRTRWIDPPLQELYGGV